MLGAIYGGYPLGTVMSVIAIILIICFFITSADSAVFVLAMLTSDGERNLPDNKKIFWGILIVLIAFALILSGGVATIQMVSIVIAFPYLFILLLCVTLVKEFRKEKGVTVYLLKKYLQLYKIHDTMQS